MFRITNWKKGRSAASGIGLAFVAAGSSALCQSPVAIAPPQPPIAQAQQQAVVTSGEVSSTLALAPIAEPQQIAPGDGRPVSVNLFEQERGSFDQIKERQQSPPRNLPQLRGTVPPAAQAPQSVADADLLRQAGIVIVNRNPDRMVVERVMPNSAAFAAGLHTGDIIARIYRGPVTTAAAPGQRVIVHAAIVPVDVERNGRISRINLNVGEPGLRTAMRPDLNAIGPAPRITSQVLPTPDSGSTTGPGVSGNGGEPQGPGTPGLGSAPSEGGGSAAMRTGRFAPVKPAVGTGRPY